MVSISISQCQTSPRVGLARLTDELLQLQERMNAALEQLLTTRATMDSHCKELELNTEHAVCLNEAQAIEAIKEAKLCCAATIKEAEVCHSTTACILQQTQRGNMLMLVHVVKAEEEWDHQAFVEAFGAALQACPPKSWGALMYPFQLMTSDMLLAAILEMSATIQLEAILGSGPAPAASIPIVLEMLALQQGAKCQCHSSDLKQEEDETVEPDHTAEECPHQKRKEGRPVAKALKKPHGEAFSKELVVVKAARWAYFKTHWPNFKEVSHDFSSTFQDMASSTNLLGTKVHEMQEEWSGWWELKTANRFAKASQRNTHFRLVAPTESPKIMGLEGIHLPKPCDGRVAYSSAHGVGKGAKMKGWWSITC